MQRFGKEATVLETSGTQQLRSRKFLWQRKEKNSQQLSDGRQIPFLSLVSKGKLATDLQTIQWVRMIKQAKSPIVNWKQIESNGFILSNRPKENKIDILF